ncbi:MAG: DUF1801 domain-containing protein [Bacteroidota bacterium]
MAGLQNDSGEDVNNFLSSIQDDSKREDAFRLLEIMEEIVGEPSKIWNTNMIRLGTYHYKYESGREGDWFITGFSPRKQNLSVYIISGFENYDELLSKLGKYKTGKSCLYIKSLDSIDENILRKLIVESVKYIREKHQS